MSEPPVVTPPKQPSPQTSQQPPLQPPMAQSNSMGSASKPSNRSVLDNRWFVLGAIFLAMMFLGLPLLWRCPAFSRLEKVLWTIATLIYSAVLFWIFAKVMSWSWQQIQNTL